MPPWEFPGGFLVSENPRLSISNRLNLTAQLARLRDAARIGNAEILNRQVIELGENTRTALTEFGLGERIYSRSIRVRRVQYPDDRIETRAFYTDSEGRETEDVFSMQHNYIQFLKAKLLTEISDFERMQTEQMLHRANIHLQSFTHIMQRSYAAFYDPDMDGAVFALSSLSPMRRSEAHSLGVDSENGYSLTGFYRVRRLDSDELRIDFYNFRSELSARHHLMMLYQSAFDTEKRELFPLFSPFARSIDVLKKPVLLSDRYIGDDFHTYLENTIYPRMRSSRLIDLFHSVSVRREEQYLRSVLDKEEIAQLLSLISEEIEAVNNAIINQEPMHRIVFLIDRMQHQLEHHAATYMHRKDPTKSYDDYVGMIQKNSTAQNDNCPSAFGSSEVTVLGNGDFIRLADGTVVENKTKCPACGRKFDLFDRKTGKRLHTVCPNKKCQYDPCTKQCLAA